MKFPLVAQSETEPHLNFIETHMDAITENHINKFKCTRGKEEKVGIYAHTYKSVVVAQTVIACTTNNSCAVLL